MLILIFQYVEQHSSDVIKIHQTGFKYVLRMQYTVTENSYIYSSECLSYIY